MFRCEYVPSEKKHEFSWIAFETRKRNRNVMMTSRAKNFVFSIKVMSLLTDFWINAHFKCGMMPIQRTSNFVLMVYCVIWKRVICTFSMIHLFFFELIYGVCGINFMKKLQIAFHSQPKEIVIFVISTLRQSKIYKEWKMIISQFQRTDSDWNGREKTIEKSVFPLLLSARPCLIICIEIHEILFEVENGWHEQTRNCVLWNFEHWEWLAKMNEFQLE